MFTVKRFKFVSRQTLFNPIEFFAVVFLFSRHAGSSSPFFFPPPPLSLSLAFQLFSPTPVYFYFFSRPLSLVFYSSGQVRSDPIRSPVGNRTRNIIRGTTLSRKSKFRSIRPLVTPRLCDWTHFAWERTPLPSPFPPHHPLLPSRT